MELTTILYICFFGVLTISGIVSWIYFKKKYSIDPITGDYLPKSEIEKYKARRKEHDITQLIYDERCQIDSAMRRIGEVCSEFHQKYGKAMDILCHIKRIKVLTHEYSNIPDEENLINYQNQFYLKVYESIRKDIYNVVEPYLIGKKEIDKKYKNKIDLRIELSKFAAHQKVLKEIIPNSSH